MKRKNSEVINSESKGKKSRHSKKRSPAESSEPKDALITVPTLAPKPVPAHPSTISVNKMEALSDHIVDETPTKSQKSKKSKKEKTPKAPKAPKIPKTIEKSGKTPAKASKIELPRTHISQVHVSTDSNDNKNSDFATVNANVLVTLAPLLLMKPEEGVSEALNGMLLRYVPQLFGVVIAYSNISYVSRVGKIMYDYPYLQFNVSTDFLVWRPRRGLTLRGVINIQSPGHIGILVYDTFNVTIPRTLIPKSDYEWVEFDPVSVELETEPEIKVKVELETGVGEESANFTEAPDATMNEVNGKAADDSLGADKQEIEIKAPSRGFKSLTQSGEWLNKRTKQRLGADGFIDFVVSDVFRVNNVLGLTGSLA